MLAGKNGDLMKESARLTTSVLASLLVWSALLLVRPPTASAVPGKLTDDAYTIGGSSTNTGIQGVLHVIDAGPSTQKTFIQFDLSSMSSLPSPLTSADVDKASLTLFVDGVGAAGSIDVREVTSAWNESMVNGMPEPTTVASTVPPFMVTTSRKFVVIDVTDLVKAWLNTPLSNHGVALAPTTPGSGLSVSFDSKENGATSHDPALEVTLIGPDGPTGPTGPTGAAGATGPTGATGATGA